MTSKPRRSNFIDNANRCTGVTNARSKTRTYAYTNRGDVTTLTMPDSTVETWSHDGTGNVTAYENQLGDTVGYTFDDAGRETGIDYPTGTDPTFGYDNADRQTSMVDSTGTYSWTYDAADEATALSTPQGNLSYTYNSDGARHTMVESVGTTTYGYDADGRLTSLANPYSETTSWTYDAADRCTQQTFGSGAYTAYGYDTRNRLTALDHKTSAAVLISSESYGYDSASNLTSKTVDSVATSYGYDGVDQLTSESRTGYSASYTYDANGNRASKTLGTVTDTYHVNDVDELTSITRPGWLTPVKSYTYDDAGRTTSVVSSAGTTSLAYDYEGRLTTITYPSTATNTFTYNALDTRVGKVDSAGTATYKRDGVDVTDPVLSDGAAAYTPGISERRSSATKYLHEDFLGSTTRLTDASQATTDTRQYDAFGNLVASTGTTPTPFGFAGGAGYQSDADSGLMLLGHRYYDPSTGRFLTRDPARDGRNWYGYCQNAPLRFHDAGGTQVEDGEGGEPGGDGPGEEERDDPGSLTIRGIEELWRDLTGDGPWNKKAPPVPGAPAEPPAPDAPPPTERGWDPGRGPGPGKAPVEITNEDRPELIPPGWQSKPSRSGPGTRWYDPDNPMKNHVRIEGDHVHVQSGGHSIGRGGQVVSGLPDWAPERHIPIEEWGGWNGWNRP